MNTRFKRFVGAMVETEHTGTNQASSGLASSPRRWDLRTRDHPFEGYPMAIAVGPYSSPPLPRNMDTSQPASVRNVDLVLTAVRTGDDAESIEVSAGLDVHHFLRSEYRAHLLANALHGGGLVHTGYETAPANVGTAVARAKWEMTGTAPAVEAFRLRPVLGKEGEVLVHLQSQMPTGWAAVSGPEAPEVDEAVLSGWTTAPADTDKLILSVPWLAPDREAVLIYHLAKLHTAIAELKALVAPPPPPADDSEGSE